MKSFHLPAALCGANYTFTRMIKLQKVQFLDKIRRFFFCYEVFKILSVKR